VDLTFQSIVHPTDFSDMSNKAFVHALRIALASKCKLYLLHVAEPNEENKDIAFLNVQRILNQWGIVDENDPPLAVANKLGLHVENVRLSQQNPAKGILSFLNQHVCDLIVLATHGRDGLEHWLKGSIAETVFSFSTISTLFIPPSANGFVSQVSGDFKLSRILVPIDHSPSPDRAIDAARHFGKLLTGADVTIHLLHVGNSAPALHNVSFDSAHTPPVMLRSGNVVQTIIDTAIEFEVDLICMATAGHHIFLDALRGSTTERVLRHAPCPLLAISAV